MYTCKDLQLELVDGALDEVNRSSVVEGDVLVSNQFDDLLARESAEEGRSRRGSQEAASNAAVSVKGDLRDSHFLNCLSQRFGSLFSVAMDGTKSFRSQTLYFGDVRSRVTLLLPRPSAEEPVELLACKDSNDNADADLGLGPRRQFLS